MAVILDQTGIRRTLIRLSHEIEERNEGVENLVLIGIKRGGEIVANRLKAIFSERGIDLPSAGISTALYRDDLVSEYFVPNAEKNELPFSVEGKKVVLCDDILHTGRSVRAAIEAIFDLGRASEIQLLELVDRGGREVPVRADYVGKNVPTSHSEYLSVSFQEIDGTDSITIEKR